MWSFIKPINLIRYLVIWRVTSSLAVLPVHFPPVLSRVLAHLIADRLSTRGSQDWRGCVDAWKDGSAPSPETAWPIDSVLFHYPTKQAYGQGEIIVWELKLLGASADHGKFLELILPAMEEAASTTDSRWHRRNWLWGNFAIQDIYVARGARWEPVVSGGKLDLDYRVTPAQWAEDLTFGRDVNSYYHTLTWVTPFELGEMPDGVDNSYRSETKSEIPVREVPTLEGIVTALMERMTPLVPGRHPTTEDVWSLLEGEEREELEYALEEAQQTSCKQTIDLKSAPKGHAGRWIGTQNFARPIPKALLPYLELASILHIGEQTHFGCGTFELS